MEVKLATSSGQMAAEKKHPSARCQLPAARYSIHAFRPTRPIKEPEPRGVARHFLGIARRRSRCFRFVGCAEGVVMIAKNFLKWTAGTAAALMALAAMPATGQARTYTGRTPASIASTNKHSVKLVSGHKKHKKHAKHHTLTSKSRHHSASKAKA
jgi:hypothetical protein